MTKIPARPSGPSALITVERVTRLVEAVRTDTELGIVLAQFIADKTLMAIPVVKEARPNGLISRHQFFDRLDQPCHDKPPTKQPCGEFLSIQPLLVEKTTPLHELSGFLSASDYHHLIDGFIITDQGRYFGTGSGQDLLREISKAHIEAARYPNPLTTLPGYVPINEHIDDLLHAGKKFAACYCDLNNFRPFNYVCGYEKGDELIRYTAQLLGGICDPVQDFIGHLGGDDFVLIMQSSDWEQRCHRALSSYANHSSELFDKNHRSIGGYLTGDRQGRVIHHPLPTLSIGAAWVVPELFGSHYEVTEAAIEARNLAKEKPGNSLFIERRRLFPHELAQAHHEGAEAHYG